MVTLQDQLLQKKVINLIAFNRFHTIEEVEKYDLYSIVNYSLLSKV